MEYIVGQYFPIIKYWSCVRDFPDFMNTLPIFDPEKSAKKFGLQLLVDLRHHKGLLEFLEGFVALITE